MKRLSIPTIIQDPDLINKKGSKKKPELPPSVVVFQHNNLIEARYSLTLQEKRLILWLISRIQPGEANFKKHELTVLEFMKLLELKGHANYKELQKITLGLMKKILVIKEPKEQRLTQVAWINYACYEEGTGRVQIAFSDAMKPFLLHLKSKFTTLDVTDLMQFTSIHGIRVYELLKQYQDIGERVLTIDEIKECCGVRNKLKKYSDFENYLLLIAQREINEKSDIHFEFERMKRSRKIEGIKFIITKNKAYESRNSPEKQTPEVKRKPAVIITLKEFGLSTRVINQLLKENTEQVIQDAINAVDLQLARGHVRNSKAMLMTAIKERWHPEKYKQR